MVIRNRLPLRTALAVVMPVIVYAYFLMQFHSLKYAAVGAVVLVCGWLAHRHPAWVVKNRVGEAVFLTAALALIATGLWQFLQMRDPGDVDHAAYACALWNLWRGNTRYSISGMDIFGNHANYTLVCWLPIHHVFGETALKLGKYLALITASIVMAYRYRGQKDTAAWIGLGILCSPPFASQFFYGFHPEFLAAPVLALAFIAYRKEQLGLFLACVFFLAYTKEVFTLAVGGMILVACVERRNWKWILAPLALGTVQMAVYWFLIMPHFSPEGMPMDTFLPQSAQALPGLLFRRETPAYAWLLLMPFLSILLGLPKRYAMVPVPLLLFYAVFPDSFRDIFRHYSFPFSLLCTAGLALFDVKPSPGLSDARHPGTEPPVWDRRIILAFACSSLLAYPVWRGNFSLPRQDIGRAGLVRKIQSMVPPDAAVLVNGGFTARFTARKTVADWTFHGMAYDHFDYIVLDKTFRPAWLGRGVQLDRDLDSLSRSPDWKLMFAAEDLYLFRRETSVPNQ